MSVQSPPVTVITLPTDLVTSTSTSAPSATTTVTTTPTTTTPTTDVTASTMVAPSPPTTIATEVEPADGLVILVFLGVAAVVGMAMIVWKLVRRHRGSSTESVGAEASPVARAGLLAERVRQIAARANVEESEPASAGIDAIALADLYPWAGNAEELTLVVDLTTAEALEIDSNTITTAAQTILAQPTGPDHR